TFQESFQKALRVDACAPHGTAAADARAAHGTATATGAARRGAAPEQSAAARRSRRAAPPVTAANMKQKSPTG
ncbi:hypothetical protein, partial [Burkholderia stabilis]